MPDRAVPQRSAGRADPVRDLRVVPRAGLEVRGAPGGVPREQEAQVHLGWR